MKAFISLREKNPEAADMWIYDEYYNGEKTPETVEWCSKKNAHFRCPNNKDHIFIKMILYMGDKNSRFYGCDICKKENVSISNPVAGNEKQPLIDESHQQAVSVQDDEALKQRKSEWSNNNPFDVSLYSDRSEYPAKWICRTCSNEYVQRISKHLTGTDNCPYCRDTSTKEYNAENRLPTLDIVYPEIARELSDKSPFKANVLLCDMPIMCTWVCGKCHGEYPARVNERTSKDFQCPYCSGKLKKEHFISIADKYPRLIDLWSKNNIGNIKEYQYTNTDAYIWKCKRCHEEYSATVSDMMNNTDNCPYCTNRIPLVGFNTITDKYPSLIKLWSDKNDKKPIDYTYTTKRSFYWKCDVCKANYLASIYQMINNTDNCPYCNNRLLFKGFNSLDVKYTEVIHEWIYEANYINADPSEILETSQKRYWWKCSKCNYKYKMSPSQKVMYYKRNKESCPYCKGLRQEHYHLY